MPDVEIGNLVYFAHPLRGATIAETQANRTAASVLVARFVAKYHVAPVCAWIHLADEWTEEEGRALGLKIDCRLIDAVGMVHGEFWMIGPDRPLSPGMLIELNHAEKRQLKIVDRRGEQP